MGQFSHAKHHRRTNNLVDGESHVPSTGIENGLTEHGERESFYAVLHEAMGDGAFAVFQIWTHLVIGWPLYLMGMASTGRLNYDGTPAEDFLDHYRPGSKMFPPKVQNKIMISTLGVVFMHLLLQHLARPVHVAAALGPLCSAVRGGRVDIREGGPDHHRPELRNLRLFPSQDWVHARPSPL